MAQFIEVNQNNPVGLDVINVRDLLFQLESAIQKAARALESISADDNTYVLMKNTLGTATTDDAHDVLTMMQAARNRLATAEDNVSDSAFLQVMKRIDRKV